MPTLQSAGPPAAAFSNLAGFWLSLSGSALLATNFVTAKYGLSGLDVPTFSFIWAVAAAALSAVVIVVTGHWREIFQVDARTLAALSLVGLLTGAGMILTWTGLSTLDPSLAAFLMRFTPLMAIALGVIFLKDRFGRLELVGVGMMVAGSLLSAAGRWGAVGPGMVYCLLACAAIAGQTFICKLAAGSCHTMVLVFYRSAGGALMVGLWTLTSGGANFDAPASYHLVTVLGALVSPVLGQLLLFRSYLHWDFSRSMVVYTSQPLFVAVLAHAFLDRWPDAQALAGGALILAGAFWFSWLNAGRSARV